MRFAFEFTDSSGSDFFYFFYLFEKLVVGLHKILSSWLWGGLVSEPLVSVWIVTVGLLYGLVPAPFFELEMQVPVLV